jgi:hypothetical protein
MNDLYIPGYIYRQLMWMNAFETAATVARLDMALTQATNKAMPHTRIVCIDHNPWW